MDDVPTDDDSCPRPPLERPFLLSVHARVLWALRIPDGTSVNCR